MPGETPTTEVIRARDYTSRDSIEKYVASVYGATPEPKDAVIEGTTEELRNVHLSHGASVWGVVVEATDYQPIVETPRVDRGAIHPSKLNGQ